ncbi:MAG: NAD+ synthase [Nitrososphaerales archaeon]
MRITSFLKYQVKSTRAAGIVLGLSGGIDSAVVAGLCVRALGSKKITALLLFEDENRDSNDYRDASRLAESLGIKIFDFKVTSTLSSIRDTLAFSKQRVSRLTFANIKARMRMTLLYAFANQHDLLVAGTGDRSEALLGYFTKFGDGAADILPIAHLYKTEVRALGSILRLPLDIISKPSSPNLWRGQKASDELPAEYNVLDPVLSLLFDEGKSLNEAAKLTGATKKIIKEVIERNNESTHKRVLPISLLPSSKKARGDRE